MNVIILSRLREFIAFFAHAWHDKRVPMIARILLLIVPIYLLAPMDLLPDHLPGGFIDDLLVFAGLLCAARYIVPRSVFVDARKAAAVGLVLFSVAGTVQDKGSMIAFAPDLSSIRTELRVMKIQNDDAAKAVSSSSDAFQIRRFAQPPPQLASCHKLSQLFCEAESGDALSVVNLLCQENRAPKFARKHRALFTKGGEDKLYGVFADTHVLPVEHSGVLMLPFNSGGIFCFNPLFSVEARSC